MSLILFNRMMHHVDTGQQCDNVTEVENDFQLYNVDVFSKSYPYHLNKNLQNSRSYLSNLINHQRLDYIVISMFPKNRFRFSIKPFNVAKICDKYDFTCSEKSMTTYLDNEELPPDLIELIEMGDFRNIYYNGSVVAEIRDYRHSSIDFYHSNFVLLKTTNQTLYNDLKKMIGLTKYHYEWTNYDRLNLESKLIFVTSPKICLNPDPQIGLISRKQDRRKLIFCNDSFVRLPRKRLKSILNRNKIKNFGIINFLRTKKTPAKVPLRLNRMVSINSEPQREVKDVETLGKRFLPANDYLNEMVKFEEFILEFLDTPGAFTKLLIFQKPSFNTYFGNLVHYRNGDTTGSSIFYLGTVTMKQTYIEQFLELISEKETIPIKIIRKVDNEEPKIRYTREVYLKKQNLLLNNKIQQNGLLKPPKQAQTKSIETNTTVIRQLQQPMVIKKAVEKEESQKMLPIPKLNNIVPEDSDKNNLSNIEKNSNKAAVTTATPTMTTTKNLLSSISSSSSPASSSSSPSSNKQVVIKRCSTNNSITTHPSVRQPLILNVNAPDGSQTPIRIPLPFALQTLKSGQLALVPTTSATNLNSLANNHLIMTKNSNKNNSTATNGTTNAISVKLEINDHGGHVKNDQNSINHTSKRDPSINI